METNDPKLDKIIDSLSEIKETLVEMKITAVKHELTLQDHTKRSLTAEENMEHLRKQVKPIEDHVAFMRGMGRTITILLTIAGIVASLYRMIH